MGSKSKSSSSSNKTTVTETKQLNLQDVDSSDGVTAAAAGNVSVNVTETDAGAVEAATRFAEQFGYDALRSVDEAIDSLTEGQREALGFGAEALGSVERLALAAVDETGDTAEMAVDRVSGHADRALTTLAAASRSDTAATLETLTKWAAGAITVIAVAWAFSKGRK